jgi:hypothetical protein
MTTPAAQTYRWAAKGFTDDVTDCEVCGKQELKGTVRMVAVDSDGDQDGEVYAGVVCAARMAGRKAAEIRAEAKAADAQTRAVWNRWSEEKNNEWMRVSDRLLQDRGLVRNFPNMSLIWEQTGEEVERVWVAANPEPQNPWK